MSRFSLIIWGRPAALNVQKVIWCVEELEIDYQNIVAGQHYGITKDQDFLAMNPNGRVPVINDNGFTLYESNAIIRYLWAKENSHSFELRSLQTWANQDRWMDWTSATLYYPNFRDFYIYFARTPIDQQDKMKGNQLLVNLLPLMTIADNQLKHHQYLAGNEFSMADIAFGVLVDKWERLNQGEGKFLNISKYYDRLLSRPHYQKHVVQFSLDAV